MYKICPKLNQLLVCCCMVLLMSPCADAQSDPETLSDAILNISKSMGYKIEMVGDWPLDMPVTRRYQAPTVEQSLRRLLGGQGIDAYVIEANRADKTISIILPVTTASSTPTDLDPWEISTEEIEKIKEDHRIRMSLLPDDTVISPPSEEGEGITLGELREIKRSHNEAMANRPDDEEISPPSAEGPGITREQLREIKENHERTVANRSIFEEISPPSEDGPGITQEELDYIKNTHQNAHREGSELTPSYVMGPEQ